MQAAEEDLIRAAIEEADLNALRVTLYQHTQDQKFVSMGVEI